jgi:hypothetical protein
LSPGHLGRSWRSLSCFIGHSRCGSRDRSRGRSRGWLGIWLGPAGLSFLFLRSSHTISADRSRWLRLLFGSTINLRIGLAPCGSGTGRRRTCRSGSWDRPVTVGGRNSRRSSSATAPCGDSSSTTGTSSSSTTTPTASASSGMSILEARSRCARLFVLFARDRAPLFGSTFGDSAHSKLNVTACLCKER